MDWNLLPLLVSLGALSVSVLSYLEARKATVAAQDHVRPILKLHDATAQSGDSEVTLAITIENIGGLPATVSELRVNTILNKQELLGHSFTIPDNLLYPGDSRR